jgi:hypothetical protein
MLHIIFKIMLEKHWNKIEMDKIDGRDIKINSSQQ